MEPDPVQHLKSLIRDVPDFPAPGILFRDITPLLANGEAFAAVIAHLASTFRDQTVDLVAGVESRGFIFGAPLAASLGAGFVPIRKVGKLPSSTVRREYSLEYGTSHLEIHSDAIVAGQRVLLIDDVLATGGTARASIELVEELGGVPISAAFLIELETLHGRDRLPSTPVFSILRY